MLSPVAVTEYEGVALLAAISACARATVVGLAPVVEDNALDWSDVMVPSVDWKLATSAAICALFAWIVGSPGKSAAFCFCRPAIVTTSCAFAVKSLPTMGAGVAPIVDNKVCVFAALVCASVTKL